MSSRLGVALSAGRDSVLASWSHRYGRSHLRGPGAGAAAGHAALVDGLLESLAVAVVGGPADLRPGAPALRDLEKATAFAGAAMANGTATGFEVAALVIALRDAVLEQSDIELVGPISELFEWLAFIALDAFASAGRRAATERAAEQLEQGTPVLLLTPEIPAVLLVGAPPEEALDGIFARAMLLVVRVAAATLIIDVSGLVDAGAPPVTEAAARLLGHRRMGSVELALVGGSDLVADRWKGMARSHGVSLTAFDRFDAAFSHAARRAGLNVISRGS
jgi:hypothetical protein